MSNLEEQVALLGGRIAALEGKVEQPGAKEPTFREKLNAERRERIELSNKKEEERRDSGRNQAHLAPQERKQEITRTHTSLLAPVLAERPNKTTNSADGAGGSTGGGPHPFKLTTSTGNYAVGAGSITDGTNGDLVTLPAAVFNSKTASTGFVVLEADVDEDFLVTDWVVVIEGNAANTAEVGMTTSDPIRQEKIRLLIGMLTVTGEIITVSQATFSSQRITYGFLNGSVVKVFESAPSHPDNL